MVKIGLVVLVHRGDVPMIAPVWGFALQAAAVAKLDTKGPTVVKSNRQD